jgi:tetratricopeptide (TPR) repeat protein
MKTINPSLRYWIPALIVSGIILLSSSNQLAQTKLRLPLPTGHVNDLAGVLDAKTKEHLESLMENLKQRSKIDFYVVTVETTGAQDIFDFSRELARDWNIGYRTSAGKTLLLVVSSGEKTSFTQFSRSVQNDLPEGILGEMSQRMRTPLGAGQFAQAVEVGVLLFADALTQKIGFSLQDIDKPVAVIPAADNSEPVASAPEPQVAEPTELSTREKTRPRVAGNAAASTPKTVVNVTKKPRPAVDDEAEAEEVELTLTLPLSERAGKLKEFLDTHPKSKARPRATELLVSVHAALGDQQLKNSDSAGGVELLMLAIDEADANCSEKLFSGVIAQIPLNLYLRGEKVAAFKAAHNVETKFGADPKRLLAVAGFYLGIERGDEAIRIAGQAVKLAPDMAEAHHALALALHISLRLDEAAAEYKRALELDPNSKRARASLADLNRAAGKSEEALALYNEQLKADPKDKAARTGVVMSLLELGRKDDANAAMETALTEDPRNLSLLTGAAYWFAAHENSEKALELANKAVAIEPRYTWAQIALAHALLDQRRPLEAERAIRFARQYGKFSTLDYELANVLAATGLYEEAAEVLLESFSLKDGQIDARPTGRLPTRETGFIELIAPERRASIYQYAAADTAASAKMLKALLSFNSTLSPPAGSEKLDENAAIAAAQEFASGSDNMRSYRELYAASRLLRSNVGLPAAIELLEDAKRNLEMAMDAPAVTVAVQADELREIRAWAINSGTTPDIPQAPRNVLANILRGRIEDLSGWALFNQDRYAEAIERLKRAVDILPQGTPSWRGASWHLAVAFEQSGNKEEALNYYIRSYKTGAPDPIRRTVIEQLYRKINGSLDGLDDRIGTAANTTTAASTPAEPTASKPAPNTQTVVTPSSVASGSAATSSPEPVSSDTPKTDAAPAKPQATPGATPEPTQVAAAEPTPTPETPVAESLDASLRAAASRARLRVKISGRVRDANKNGLGNVVVVLISPSGTVLASTTDSEGNFSFVVATSQRTYRLIPSRDGYRFEPVDKVFDGLSDDQKEIEFVGTLKGTP